MIRREFLLAFTAIALLLIFNSMTFTLLYSDTSDRLEAIVDDYTPAVFALQNLARNATRMQDEALSTFLLLQSGQLAQAQAEESELEDAYLQFQASYRTYAENDSPALDPQLAVLGDQIYDASRALIDYGFTNTFDTALTVAFQSELETLEDTFSDTFSTAMQAQLMFLNDARERAEDAEILAFAFSLGFSVIAVFGAVSLGSILSNRIMRPVKRLELAAHNATQGKYDTEVYVEGHGELVTLANGFNQMMRAIKQRDDELHQLNYVLEERIHERTQALVVKAEEAQVANRLKDEFMAAMSHELRTPLNAIIGYIGIMQMMGDLDEENLQRVQTMETSANQLLELINDVLDLSRIEAGQFKPNYQPVALIPTTQGILRKFEGTARKKGVKLKIEVTQDAPKVLFTDEFAFNKILTHLLDNAIKFTHEGQVTIYVGCKKRDVIIRITDTGIGIPPEQHTMIFERFRQGDGSSSRVYGGTGLGLSIVRSLCIALNGSVEVESTFHTGSTFTVKLPYQQNIVARTED